MTVNLILATNAANQIGYSNGKLPWHLSNDLKRFKLLTMGHPVVMGLNTFKSIQHSMPSGFPGRDNHILSTTLTTSDIESLAQKNIKVHSSLSACLATLEGVDIWLIGGASLYDSALKSNCVDNLYLTLVHKESDCDVFLKTDLAAWKLFILKQRAEGIYWNLTQMDEGSDFDREGNWVSYWNIVLHKEF